MAEMGSAMSYPITEGIRCRWCNRHMLDVGGLMLCPHHDAPAYLMWRSNHVRP